MFEKIYTYEELQSIVIGQAQLINELRNDLNNEQKLNQILLQEKLEAVVNETVRDKR